MINLWEIIAGVFTILFLLAVFYFLSVAGIRDYGKRGVLIMASVALLGTGFVFDLISEVYENQAAELLSHGAVIIAGILFLLSFYLSKKELEKEGGEYQYDA